MMSDITGAEQKVLDAIKASYGGAVSIAAVHGWRFTGEAGEGGWPVSLLEALRLYGAEQQRAAWADVPNEIEACCPSCGTLIIEDIEKPTEVEANP